MGEIYVWGTPTNLKNFNNYRKYDSQLRSSTQIAQISCGESHFFILTTQNQIIGYGRNDQGQLGITQEQYQHNQCQVKPMLTFRQRTIQISCGWNHTLLLTQRGHVYSCGQGTYGALGNSQGQNSDQFKQVQIRQGNTKNYAKIMQISAGKDHSLAVSDSKVYGWGNSRENQLGLLKQKIFDEPQQLYIFHSYLCYAGQNCSFFCTKDGIYATGSNSNGKLGLGHEKKVKIPKKINFNSKAIRIQDGLGYILIQNENHEFYLCGKGSLGSFIYPTKIIQFKQYNNVWIGPNFGIVQNKSFDISTWNFQKQPSPQHHNYLSNLHINLLSMGPKLIIGFSDKKQCSLPKNKSMVKSAFHNDFSHLNNQRRKVSDDLNNIIRVSTPNDLDHNENQLHLQNGNQEERGGTCYGDYGREDDRFRFRIEEIEGQVQTPIFMRTQYQPSDQRYEDQIKQQPQSSYQFLNTVEYIKTLQKPPISHIQQSQLKQKIASLEQENLRKDSQLRETRSKLAYLIDIIESDNALKKIIELKNPEYFNQKPNNNEPTNRFLDKFHQNSNHLKKLLNQLTHHQ